MTRRRIVEWIKNILIVLLLCSAVALSAMANNNGMLPDLSGLLSGAAGTSAADETVRTQPAATPVQISIRTDAGRASVLYDAQELEHVYELLGGSLGQALEMADNVQESTLGAVQAALQDRSIFFAYPGAVPLAALAQWLDAESSLAGQASWFALRIGEETAEIYYGGGETVCVCQTFLQTERLIQELERFRPDGTVFAFESELFSSLWPLTLLDPEGAFTVYQAEASAAYDERFVSTTASLLGFNPYGEGYYTELSGTVVFSEIGCSLRIAPDGTISVMNQNSDNSRLRAQDASLAAAIETARALLTELTQSCLGDGALYLTAVSASEDAVTMTFEYYLNGVPVHLEGGAAATVTVRRATVTELTLRVRRYTLQTDACVLIPVKQVQALARPGGQLMLAYADAGDGAMTAGWTD